MKKELSNTRNGFGHYNNEGEIFKNEKQCKTLSVAISIKSNEEAVAKQKPRFTFHKIKNVSRTSGKNVKQPKAQKANKKLPKSRRAHRLIEPTLKKF